MPEADGHTETSQQTTVTPESLGWRAALPDDLKQHEAIVPFKTVGDLAKQHLANTAKVTELEGKLARAVPKPPDNATDLDRDLYLNALGRPSKSSEYEFDGEDKNAPEWTNYWKQQFHGLGLTKDQAKQLSTVWNKQMQDMVSAHNATVKAESDAAESKLRTELGDKYDTNVELAKRFWQKHGDSDFDKTFGDGSGANRFAIIRALLKFAALTGEDMSSQGSGSGSEKQVTPGFVYDKSPAPPAR